MSNRNPGWTYSDALAFINVYDAQIYYEELVTLGEWYPPIDDPFDDPIEYLKSGYFYIGGLNPHGSEDDQDIAPIWLGTEWTYSFGVGGESDYIHEGLWLEVFDDSGYLLTSTHGIPDTITEDLILNFKPSYTGWHYVWINTDSYLPIYAELVVGSIGLDVKLSPYIINQDDYNWDNDINTGNNTYIPAEDAQLYRAYMGAMGRLPDSGGFNWWANEIELGRHNLFTMSDGFISSSEFKGYADSNYDGYISDHEFITHMYEGVFGRAPDQGGYEYWIDQLNSGASDQGEVLVYMTQSNEYIDQTLETVADYLFI